LAFALMQAFPHGWPAAGADAVKAIDTAAARA
jgi:hypothetical protein